MVKEIMTIEESLSAILTALQDISKQLDVISKQISSLNPVPIPTPIPTPIVSHVADVKYSVKNFFLKDGQGKIQNLCGDLQCTNKDYAWDRSEWFASEADKGQTVFTLSFSPDGTYGISQLHFENAHGNRPFPYQAVARGTMNLVPISSNVTLEADVLIENFEDDNTMLRMALVVHLAEKDIYLEQDFKDSPKAKAIMPFTSPNCNEDIVADVPLNVWTHIKVDFMAFAKRFNITQGTIDSCYLVVENFSD